MANILWVVMAVSTAVAFKTGSATAIGVAIIALLLGAGIDAGKRRTR